MSLSVSPRIALAMRCLLVLCVPLLFPTRVDATEWAILRAKVVNANGVSSIDLPTRAWSALPARGFSFGLSHDPTQFTLTAITPADTIAAANGGLGPDVFLIDLAPLAGAGGTVQCTIGDDLADAIPPYSGPHDIAIFTYDVLPGGTEGFSPVDFAPGLGVPSTVEWSFPAGMTVDPHVICGGIVYHEPPGVGSPIGGSGEQLWFLNGGDGTISVVSLDGILLDTLSAGGQLGPAGVAVGSDGLTWVTFRDSDAVVRFDLTGNVVDVIPVGDGPVGIALDSGGNAWVANSLEDTLTKIAPDGVILRGGDPGDGIGPDDGTIGGAIAVAAGPTGVAVDGLDNVAVACTFANSIEKRNSDGSLVWSVLLPPTASPTGVAVDRDLYIWVTSTVSGRIERLASDGSSAEVFPDTPGTSPRAITIRGRDEAWVAGEADGTLRRYRPGGESTVFPIGGTPSGIAADAAGDLWVTDRTAGTVTRYAPDGTPGITVAIGAEPEFLGDAFGLVPANVLQPELDFDVDGTRNDLEVDAFTNPYDATDEPTSLPTYVPPVLDLTCSAVVQSVSLAWVAPTALEITSFEVRRDGVLVASLPPGSGTYSEAAPLPIGTYAYTVTTIDDLGGASVSANCTAVVGAGNLQETTTIQVPGLSVNLFGITAVPAPEAGAVAYYLTDPGNDRIYATDIDFNVLETIISPFQGFAPTTGIAYDATGNGGLGSLVIGAGANGDPDQNATVLEIALDGTPLGSPVQLVRPIPSIGGSVEIKGGVGGITKSRETSTDGHKIYMAVTPEVCELFSFSLESSTIGIGGVGTLEVPIIPEASAVHPEPGYGLNGIYFPPFSSFDENGGTVLSSNLEADGTFSIVRLAIANGQASIVSAAAPLAAPPGENVFGDFVVEGDRVATVGITTSSIHQLGSAFFVRGDANDSANGGAMIDIGDAISVLDIAFRGIPALPCVDAYDVDDDGGIRINDAIYLLSYLFIQGPPPASPFPVEGPDATPDELPCF